MENILLEDIAALKFISAPTLSPDGSRLACVVTESDWKANDYKTNAAVVELSAGTVTPLGTEGKDGAILWEDGDTLLIQTKGGAAKEKKAYETVTDYERVNVRTGERTQAFSIGKNVGQIKKWKDGLYVLTAEYDKNAPDPATTPEDECMEALDYHVIEEAPLWENGKGFISGKRQVLYLFEEASGALTPITNPTTEVYDFSLGEDVIAIVGRDWKDLVTDTCRELYLYHAESGEMEVIVPQKAGKVEWASFVEDQLIYTFTDNKSYGNTQMCDFYAYDMTEQKSRFLCTNDGMAVGGGVLTDVCYGGGTTYKTVGDAVFFVGLEGYERALYSVDATGTRKKKAALSPGSIQWFDADEKTICVVAAEQDKCMDLYCAPCETTPETPEHWKQLTAVNEAYFMGKYVAKTEYVPFVNSAGISIDGWVIKPVGYDAKKTYPAVFEIHGGPRAAYGTIFLHEMQAMAGAGYFVFFCNPRGSEGRGEEFADIRGKHGTIDYDDLMEFMDHILEKFPQIDSHRVAAAGGSYAGFMCNWIEGHTDRFAAIASQRSDSDFVADYCISDIGFTYDREAAGGDPWNDTEKLWFHSPYRYAPFAKTPILFIHSLCDYDCTIDQGVMMFQAMKYFGVPSRMCLFEGENHELSRTGKPRHRVRRLKEIFSWIGTYLGQEEK